MNIVILNYWGYETDRNYYRKRANHALRCLAQGLVRRLKKTKTLGEKRLAYRKYFEAYYRTAHYRNYPGLYSRSVQKYIWSFARYVALNMGYDIEELRHDWQVCIGSRK